MQDPSCSIKTTDHMNPPRKEKAARTSCCGNTLLAGWLPSAKVHHRKTNRRETSSCRAAPPLGQFLCVSGSQQKTWRLLVKNNRQGRSGDFCLSRRC